MTDKHTELIVEGAAPSPGIAAQARLFVRLPLLTLWTAGMFGLRLCVVPIKWLDVAAERRARAALLKFWGRVTFFIIGAHVRIEGRPPNAPFFLVSNHLTLLDIVMLSAGAGAAFVSRDDVETWPVIGYMAKKMNTIFIDRGNARDTMRVNELIGRALDSGLGVAVFAESRCGKGDAVLPFKAPLLQPVVQLGMPVYFATINYSTPPGAPPPAWAIVWREGVSFGQYCIDVLRLPGFSATIHFGSEPIAAPDRKILADKLWHAVKEKYEPM